MPSLPQTFIRGPQPGLHPIGWGWEIPPIIAKLWMRKLKNLFSHACGNILEVVIQNFLVQTVVKLNIEIQKDSWKCVRGSINAQMKDV